MDIQRARSSIDQQWDDSILPELIEYVRIPSKSPAFDPDWASHGYMDDAVSMMERWCRDQNISGASVEVVRLPGRTPVLTVDIPAFGEGTASADKARASATVLLYGHLDKQPEMSGWRDDLGPWIPKLEDGKLYGRGGADDGYAVYSSLAAVMALREQNLPHARCFVLIEACEESGSYDLPFYMEALESRIGEPDLVICLDSGCGNYDQLWCTTSLRGMAAGTFEVRVLTEGVHSGNAGGIVPSSFRISRALIERVEEASTGVLKDDSFFAQIPEQRRRQAAQAASVLGEGVYAQFPFAEATQPYDGSPEDLILNRTWRPALAVVGAEGMPSLESAGNVLRPYTSFKLSMRLPPTCDAQGATDAMARLLETDPPHGASVRFEPEHAVDGWDAPPTAPWLEAATQKASIAFFGADCVHMGEGGSIPFMGMLGEQYPKAQFMVTGVLGPQSNAHGPNEFLHLQTAKCVTACVASVLADHARACIG